MSMSKRSVSTLLLLWASRSTDGLALGPARPTLGPSAALGRRRALGAFIVGAALPAAAALPAEDSDSPLVRELLQRSEANRAKNARDAAERTYKNQKATNRDPFKTEQVVYADGTWDYLTPLDRDKLRAAGRLDERDGIARVLEPKATASPSDRDDPKPLAFGEAGPLTRQVMEQKPKNYLGSMFESSF